jgi:hypothetical protein
VLEIVRGPDKGRYWTVTGVERGKVMAVDGSGERRLFGRQRAGLFDACEQRQINLAVGDRVLIGAGMREREGRFRQRRAADRVGLGCSRQPGRVGRQEHHRAQLVLCVRGRHARVKARRASK